MLKSTGFSNIVSFKRPRFWAVFAVFQFWRWPSGFPVKSILPMQTTFGQILQVFMGQKKNTACYYFFSLRIVIQKDFDNPRREWFEIIRNFWLGSLQRGILACNFDTHPIPNEFVDVDLDHIIKSSCSWRNPL